ncbi:MAG: hypothetical protein ACKOFJ_05660 [Actinomycetota bacterium]
MGSGLIYLIIVGMWISYFLPRWISTHEEVSGRTVEKFEKTMKVVGVTSGNAAPDYEEIARRRQQQVAVRRIMFFSIIGLTLVVTLFALFGLVSPIILTLPISAFVMYIVHARHQIHLIQEEIKRARSIQKVTSQPSSRNYSEIIARSKSASTKRTIFESLSSGEQWTPLSERVASYSEEVQSIVILPKGSAAQNSNTWEPTAVPAPSYVSAPKAAQRRVIDLTIPGAWSEAQERAMREAMAPASNQIFDQVHADEIEEQIRIQRASGE